MRIQLEIIDIETSSVLEDLGECLTNNPDRAAQMYEDDCTEWADKGYSASIHWTDITDQAAASLGRRGGKSRSDAKRKANAANGKLGGRPVTKK